MRLMLAWLFSPFWINWFTDFERPSNVLSASSISSSSCKTYGRRSSFRSKKSVFSSNELNRSNDVLKRYLCNNHFKQRTEYKTHIMNTYGIKASILHTTTNPSWNSIQKLRISFFEVSMTTLRLWLRNGSFKLARFQSYNFDVQ
ncbi:hypothetical protein HanXRQr2_Chr10g0463911 [Helianthus annuus]|uniref:Uncharacterized protein n=1 Tax=Helianthus annuus TaxID=4232 RepID=A0A9K3I268_HELAN|nr:hypothetical protein HanXRQr2_Chr10g0463911 [Helianthus annuus]KAJ0885669.1 hypothetical protein HanPSC8_Chr10g0447721 [Helianthus annuus]